jgi:hypothetical protein
VQPLHNEEDGARALVVEPAVERVLRYHSLQACRSVLDSASSGFSGSSIAMMSVPRPVSTPPVEVASR